MLLAHFHDALMKIQYKRVLLVDNIKQVDVMEFSEFSIRGCTLYAQIVNYLIK